MSKIFIYKHVKKHLNLPDSEVGRSGTALAGAVTSRAYADWSDVIDCLHQADDLVEQAWGVQGGGADVSDGHQGGAVVPRRHPVVWEHLGVEVGRLRKHAGHRRSHPPVLLVRVFSRFQFLV